MRELPLTKGFTAIVDDDVFADVSRWKWTAVVTGQHIKRVYAYRRVWDKERRRSGSALYLHREIMRAPQGLDVDHINGDTLDNQLSNLRLATRRQNLANGRHPVGRTGFRGVAIESRGARVRYVAQSGGVGYVGTFGTAAEAAHAYDLAARHKFGPFAKLNFP